MCFGREGEGMRIIDEKAMEKDRRWQAMTMKDKVGDWASRHEYSIILGGWAASMGVAGGIISRQKYVICFNVPCNACSNVLMISNRYQTYSQKVRYYVACGRRVSDITFIDCASSYVGSSTNHRPYHWRRYPYTKQKNGSN